MPDDEQVMAQVRDGRVEMLAILFERHHVRMYNFFLRLTGNRPLSEDLTQELFLRILKYRQTYRGESKFSTWIYQIARNLHIDQLRSSRPQIPIDDLYEETPCAQAGPAEKAETRQEADLLQRAMERLPLRKREVLLLSRFQDLKYQEIAGLLECSIENVKVQVHRSLKELRKHYLDLQGGTR